MKTLKSINRKEDSYPFWKRKKHMLCKAFALAVFVFSFNSISANVIITQASNGINLCSVSAANGSSPSWTTLDDILITEALNDDFPKNSSNETITISAPAGWSFNTGIGSVAADGGGDISSISISVTSTTAVITWSTPNGGGDNSSDIITVSGLQVQANNTTSSNGDITCTALSKAVAGITSGLTTFGSLSLFPNPTITSNPSDASVLAGTNTSFSLTADSSPISYSWEVSTDGGTIYTTIVDGGVYSNSTTSTLTITGATLSMDAYKYRAYATNSCGTSNASTVANLTVTDLCSSVSVIADCGVANSVTATTSTSGVLDPPSTSCGYSTPGGEKLYSFTPTTSGDYNLVVSSDDGTYIDYFYQSGTCSSSGWTCIGDISMAGTYGPLSLTAGTTYYILLDDENTTSSSHTFYLDCPVTPPANDECSNAIVLPCGTTDLAGTTNGSTNIAHGTSCSISNYGVWYTFTGDGTETTISIVASYDVELSISSGSCGSFTNIACEDASSGDESYTFTTTSSVDYYIYIAHYSSGETTTGDFTISRSACPTDMNFVSCTSTQNNTGVVSTGSENQEVMCIQIETSGALNPLSVSELVLRTDGTDSYSADISNANIWYTGNNSNFTTSSQFGSEYSTPPAPGSDMAFSDSQTLLPGTNYFWLTYDVSNSATEGNVVDALFYSAVVDGNTETPAIDEPVGDRSIIRGCYYNLTLMDDFGTWSGNTITVKVDGVVQLSDVTLSSGTSETHTFIAETGQTITTEYTGTLNQSDNSYIISNPNGAYIASSGDAQTVPQNITATADCDKIKKFTMNGDTYQNGEACFIITENKASKSGSVWSNFKIDLVDDFTVEFDLYMGANIGGADGVVFAMQGSCTSAGGSGSSLGYGGINNSLGIEFDTYENGDKSDPVSDHVAIVSNGDPDHGSSTNLAGPYDTGNLEDNAWHSVVIDWFSGTNTLRITFDGTPILSYTGDVITDQFAGDSQVFWGLTGGTGALYNEQKVCISSYPQNSTEMNDTSICATCTVDVEVASGANSYTWLPDDGTVSNTTAYNPTLSPTETTEYTCLIEDGCGNVLTNKFTVFVGTLPVELTVFEANCKDSFIDIYWKTESEVNNDYFIIESSTNLIDFDIIATINGSGNSNTIKEYSYQDYNLKGTKYYRLTQVDFDGTVEVFYVITTSCTDEYDELDVSVYPNPFSKIINLDIQNIEPGLIEINIYDQTGRIVHKESSNSTAMATFLQIQLPDLMPSVYLLQIKSHNVVVNSFLIKKD